jgi:hypothetical protein
MILTKKIKLETKGLKKIKHYIDLGYDISKSFIEVEVDDLIKGSSELVSVKCDFCSRLLETTYNKYNCSISIGNKYACSTICAKKKAKISNLEKYGVENVSQIESIKLKKEETTMKNYGVKHVLSSKIVKDIIKNNNLEKYGVENVSQIESIKLKKEETTMKNYGVINPFQSESIKEKSKVTNLERYGVENVMKSNHFIIKSKVTNLKRYGFDSYTKTDEYKEKYRNTNLEKYGVEYSFQSELVKDKIKLTCLEKYGVEYSLQSNLVKEKSKITNNKKYGVDKIQKSEDYRKINYGIAKNIFYIKYIDNQISIFNCDCEKNHTFEIHIDNYHHRNNSNISLCTVCYPIGEQTSFIEKDLLRFISTIYSGEIISSYRDGLEIDIYLPELKLGFEFNGLYWHSEKFKEKNYHLNKTNYFKEKGIRIIHIWEDDWIFKKDILESQIKNILKLNSDKVFARNCSIRIVDVSESKKFLDDNHIQGTVSSAIKIGLYYNDELVSVMTFDHFEGRKRMEEGGYNLNRFCNKLGFNIIGGTSKLLSYFIQEYKPKRIVSYADKDWSVGNLYYILGFENVSDNSPDYKYIVGDKRIHKSRYKKSRLNTDLTESKQMSKNGFLKIYDCGKLKFELKI